MSEQWWRVVVFYAEMPPVPHIFRCAERPSGSLRVVAGPFPSLVELLLAEVPG